MTLQPIPSAFPYIWEKFRFPFYQCICTQTLCQFPIGGTDSVSGFGGILTKNRRNIRLIENKAKCRSKQKFTWKGTLRQVFYLSEASSASMTPYSPPLTHCIRVYSILIHTGTGKGGGVGELTRSRKKVRGAIVHKAGRKYQHDGLYLQSIKVYRHKYSTETGFLNF